MNKYFITGLQILLVLFFIAPGVMKLMGNPMMIETFERFGYSVWFMYFIGAAEVAGAIGIAVGSYIDKRLPNLAAIGLIIVMIGAFASHLMFDDQFSAAVPALVNIGLLSIFLYLRRKNSIEV